MNAKLPPDLPHDFADAEEIEVIPPGVVVAVVIFAELLAYCLLKVTGVL